MNPSAIHFELNEAHIHLGELVKELASGNLSSDADSGALAVELNHIWDHLCRAWNTKDLTPEQKDALSQEEFGRASNTVPNLLGERVIGDY